MADAALAALGDWLAEVAPRARRLHCRQAQLPSELLLGIGPMDRAPWRQGAALDAGALFDSLSLEFDHAVDMPALATMLAAAPLRLLRAKGLMRERDGQTRSLQLIGARSALAPSAHDAALTGRLVCIALCGELQAERLRAALKACAV